MSTPWIEEVSTVFFHFEMEVPNFLCFCPLLAECTLVHNRQLQKHFNRFRKKICLRAKWKTLNMKIRSSNANSSTYQVNEKKPTKPSCYISNLNKYVGSEA